MKISVVIPTYNHAQWLPFSITSALSQTLKPHEVIVVDDGSKDNTREVASQYPVTYIYQQNSGLSASRNRGISASSGDWIALLDADDYWAPNKLELQSAAIDDQEMCYCATMLVYPDGHTAEAEYIPAEQASRMIRHHNFIDPSSVLLKKTVLDRVGGFNVRMPAGEDWEMWLRLAPVCKFASVPQRLLMYRVTGTGMSANPEIFFRSMEDIVAAGTAGMGRLSRFLVGRRMRSVRCALVAGKYRDLGSYAKCLKYALRGFFYWPSPFYDRAFKMVLVELKRYLTDRNSFSKQVLQNK